MIGRCAYMLCHSAGGEEHTGTPLDEETLLGIGVVAYPELVKVRHQAIIDTASAAGAALDNQIGILGTDAFKGLAQS